MTPSANAITRDARLQPAAGDRLRKGQIHRTVHQLWVAENGTKMVTVSDRNGSSTMNRYPTLNQYRKWVAEAQVVEQKETEAYWK